MSRIYVDTTEGQQVGWFDCKTGKRNLEIATMSAEFDREIDDALAHELSAKSDRLPKQRERNTGPRSRSRRSAQPPLPADPPPPVDLVANAAGHSLRDKAVAPATDDPNMWLTGAAGEEYVGSRLCELTDSGWGYLHSIPLGPRGADIDHLLIGLGGVVALNTKNRPQVRHVKALMHEIYADGHATNYSVQVRDEASKAGEALSTSCGFPVPVQPGLVILTGQTTPRIEIREDPYDILILHFLSLVPTILQLPPVYDDKTIATVFDRARWSTTWPGGGTLG